MLNQNSLHSVNPHRQYYFAPQSSKLETLLNEVGEEIKDSIDDPYGYMVRYQLKQDSHKKRSLAPRISPRNQSKGIMTIVDIWPQKLKKQCDMIIDNIKTRQTKQKQQEQAYSLNLTKLQSNSNRLDSIHESEKSPQKNASKLIQLLGLKTLMKKKRKVQLDPLTKFSDPALVPQSPVKNLSPTTQNMKVKPEGQSLPKLQRIIQFNSASTSTTQNGHLIPFRKYSEVNNSLKMGIKHCISNCETSLQESKSLQKQSILYFRIINRLGHSPSQHFAQMMHQETQQIILYERGRKK